MILGGDFDVDVFGADGRKTVGNRLEGKFRPVTVTAKVTKIEVVQVCMDDFGRCRGCGFIGEMAVSAENALFEAPRSARVVLKHAHVVIGFQHEHMSGANTFEDQVCCVAEVGQETEMGRSCANEKADGI